MARQVLNSLHGRQIGLASDGGLVVLGEPDGATLSAAAGTTNQTLVTIQAVNNEGLAFAGVLNLFVWLSDSAVGAGLTATTASGAVAAGASGTDLGDLTAKKAKYVQTDATGKYILAITDTAKTNFKVCAKLDASRKVSPDILTLATGNFG